MLNERIEIVFVDGSFDMRVLGPDEYVSLLYLEAGVQIVESQDITTLHPWSAIHSITKIRMLDDPSASRTVVRERAIA